MTRWVLALVVAAAACAPAHGPRGRMGGPPLRPEANPSAVIATELAFSRLAQAKGQWTAFRETMAPEAQMYVPQRVLAADWLKGRADPPIAVKWAPAAVWSSCDGSYAVTRGTWQRPGSTGSFLTIWQRQQPDGPYRWLLDLSIATDQPVGDADTIAAKVSTCNRRGDPRPPMQPAPPADDAELGASDDRTLQWTSWGGTGGNRQVAVYAWNGASFDEVLRASAPLPTR